VAATNSANRTKKGKGYVPLISLLKLRKFKLLQHLHTAATIDNDGVERLRQQNYVTFLNFHFQLRFRQDKLRFRPKADYTLEA